MPSHYLLKTEASVYSFANLQRDKQTQWDGVSNPTAVRNLRDMKPGDKLIVYHTGDEKSAIGTASVVSVKVTDPKTPVVEIKASSLFADSPLVRQGRLSVVPLTAAQYAWLAGE